MDNQIFDRKKLLDNILLLLPDSLLFTLSQKQKIKDIIDTFTDEELVSFAKLLVVEEQNKTILDAKMVKTFEEELNKDRD